MTTKKIKFTTPLYDIKVVVLVGDTIQELVETHIPEYAGNIDYEAAAYCIQKPDGSCILLFTQRPSPGTVTHETFHLTIAILSNAGCKLTPESEEAYAYLNGWLNNKILNKIYDN